MEGMGNQIEMDGFDKLIDTGSFLFRADEIALIRKKDGDNYPSIHFFLKGNSREFIQPYGDAELRDQYFNAIVKKMIEL